MTESLSEKRRRAGRAGAAARWNGKAGRNARPSDYGEALKAWREGRPKDAARFRITNRAGADDSPAELWIYDEIVDPFLASIGWGVSATTVVDEIRDVTADRITVHINSPGGDVFEGHAIYNALRDHPADIDVTIDGIAASAASYIAMAGDTIEVESNAMFMIHDAHGITFGNSADHQDMAGRLDKISDGIAAIYAERAGGTKDEWRAAMQAETWYDADEAVTAGLADKVRDREETPAAARVNTAPFKAAAGRTITTDNPGRETVSPEPPAGAVDDAFDVDAFTKALEGAFA